MASTFNEAPFDYENVRPGYPRELFNDLSSMFGLREGSRVLEVGCGTGQATSAMLDRGYRMHCLDIGESLLELAREKFRGCEAVFECVSFEDWYPDRRDYDLVMSATAWHWVDQAIGYRKAYEVLGADGGLALLWNKHPTPYTGFFEDVQRVYDEYYIGSRSMVSTGEWIKEQVENIEGSGFFTDVKVSQYPWRVRFSRDQYLSLLNTFSDHRMLPDENRKKLYDGVSRLINKEYDGYVDRPYLSVLFTAKKNM